MITTLILETRSIIHITVRFEEHHYSYLILHYLKLYYQVSFKNIKRISIARQYIHQWAFALAESSQLR